MFVLGAGSDDDAGQAGEGAGGRQERRRGVRLRYAQEDHRRYGTLHPRGGKDMETFILLAGKDMEPFILEQVGAWTLYPGVVKEHESLDPGTGIAT